jgi:hypothetical protein
MPDPVVQDGLQVVSAGGLAEQTKQNMFEAHASHYITHYINVNCFSVEPCYLAFSPLLPERARAILGPQSGTFASQGTPLAQKGCCARRRARLGQMVGKPELRAQSGLLELFPHRPLPDQNPGCAAQIRDFDKDSGTPRDSLRHS